MRAKVRAACLEENLSGQTVVCALSGGGDSVALCHCLLSLQEELGFHLKAAHFNHKLRGRCSDEDEAFVRQLCDAWQIPLSVGHGDPGALKDQSPEEAARTLRYEFLLAQTGIIALAHHGDDQVETVLLNLLRGTGLRGLCAMARRRDRLFRPMLSVTGQEIDAYLAEHRLSYQTDHTNDEDGALRNRLRHHVIPLLQTENPSLTQTVSRMTALLQEDDAYLSGQARELLQEARRDNGYCCSVLLAAPAVLRRRALRQLLKFPKPSMVHVEQLEKLLEGTGSVQIPLPGNMVARRVYDRLILEEAQAEEPFSPVTLVPGEEVSIPSLGFMASLTEGAASADGKTVFALSAIDGPVTLRPRQTGDRILLPGGHKTLKNWMIDEKIPAHLRNCLPVAQDRQGILAVYGLGADCSRTAQPGQPAWILKFWKKGSPNP